MPTQYPVKQVPLLVANRRGKGRTGGRVNIKKILGTIAKHAAPIAISLGTKALMGLGAKKKRCRCKKTGGSRAIRYL